VSTTLVRVTAPHAVFGFVVDDRTRRVVACAPIGRRLLMGTTAGEAVASCRGRGWRTETVREEDR